MLKEKEIGDGTRIKEEEIERIEKRNRCLLIRVRMLGRNGKNAVF